MASTNRNSNRLFIYFLRQYLWSNHINSLLQNPDSSCNIPIILTLAHRIFINSLNIAIILSLKRPHLNQKHQAIGHFLRILLILKPFTFGDNPTKLSSSIRPIIKRSNCRVDHLIHGPNFKLIQFTAISSLSTHHPRDVDVDIVVFSVAVCLMQEGAPVEGDLAATVVEDDSQIDSVLTEQHVEDVGGSCLVAVSVSVDWIVPVRVYLSRYGFSSSLEEA